MSRVLAIALVTWIFVASPTLCLAGWCFGVCEHEHETYEFGAPCGSGHQCQYDPCHVNATVRPADDDVDLHQVLTLFACFAEPALVGQPTAELAEAVTLLPAAAPTGDLIASCAPLLI